MQNYGTDHIRNVVLLSHCGAGKSSLSEAMLFTSGAIPRLGRVDDGSSTSDFDPDEIKRKISINLSVLPLEWSGNKINILDAPGYADFVAGAVAGAAVADAAVIVVCAASGIEVGTELMWKLADCPDSSLSTRWTGRMPTSTRWWSNSRRGLAGTAYPWPCP
jgi:elongation factor G